ncbi:hypothetical protein, partial [Aeromonas caviae]|uniref:hypothetical protein n=1 Tax=Aeromonas caviae TaxID=648 RepID=UPI002B464DC6
PRNPSRSKKRLLKTALRDNYLEKRRLRRPVGSISAASSDEREVLIVVVAVQQERSAGGRNAAGRYGWIINLCKHPITSTG